MHSMDRLVRNLDDPRWLVQTLTKRAIRIEFVKECLSLTCEDSPMANPLLSFMGGIRRVRASLDRRAAARRDRTGQAGLRQSRVQKSAVTNHVIELHRRAGPGDPKASLAR